MVKARRVRSKRSEERRGGMIGETIEEIEEMRGKEETDEMDAMMMTGRREEKEETMRRRGKIGMTIGTEKREGKRKRRRIKRKRTRRKRSQSMPGTQQIKQQ
jgi:hypothetical protein